MEVYDFNTEQKKIQQFLTPKKLVEHIQNQCGDLSEKVVFDPAVGSGQLLTMQAKKKIGVEIEKNSANCACKNGVDVYNEDYLLFDMDKVGDFDFVISNPPFSLDGTEEQLTAMKNEFAFSTHFTKFYKKDLLQWFVIKSFSKAKEKGVFILFPGLCYRETCKEFRKWLVDNNFLEKIQWLKKPGFESTSIDVVVFVLNKNKQNNGVLLQLYDNYNLIDEQQTTTEELKKEDYHFRPPAKEEKRKTKQEQLEEYKRDLKEWQNTVLMNLEKNCDFYIESFILDMRMEKPLEEVKDESAFFEKMLACLLEKKQRLAQRIQQEQERQFSVYQKMMQFEQQYESATDEQQKKKLEEDYKTFLSEECFIDRFLLERASDMILKDKKKSNKME